MSATSQAHVKPSTRQENGNACPPEGPKNAKAKTQKRKHPPTGDAGGSHGSQGGFPFASFCTVEVDPGTFKEIQELFGRPPQERFKEAQQKFRAHKPRAHETAISSFVTWLQETYFNSEESGSSSSAASRTVKCVTAYIVGPPSRARQPGTLFTVMCSKGEEEKEEKESLQFHLPCDEKTLRSLLLFSSLDKRSRVHSKFLQEDTVFPFINMKELCKHLKESMKNEETMLGGCDVDQFAKFLFHFVLTQAPDKVEKDVGRFRFFAVFLSFLKENDMYKETALSFFLLECFFLTEVLFADTQLWSKVHQYVSSRAERQMAV